jgi:16S rRNA (cytidine1402-2'-O)-methyltransferase
MAKLFVVPTPIGNLDDITLRAITVLKEADFILAEDTRTSGFLLKHFDIQNRLQAYHKFNEHKSIENIIKKIKESNTVALISDAGTPAISDPGYLLTKHCIENGITVECLPGATALIPAIVNSGLPNDRFVFEGFLPQKKGRQKRIEALKDEVRTIVFYESPHRLIKTLTQLLDIWGENRQVCVSRELSKIHEENYRGSLLEAIEHFSAKNIKGEIVIVVNGK